MNKNKKILFACITGTMLEWYDIAIFGALAPVISSLFFPNSNHLISLIETFGVFALGFAVRPFGSVVFGYIGDRYGRKKTLILTIVIMLFSTTLIGVLPTYATIGIVAPFFLTLMRICQGLSASGEHAGAVVYISELMPNEKRGFYTSLCFFGVIMGMLSGSLIGAVFSVIMPHTVLINWGWRLPFLFSFILGLAAIYLRKTACESPVFKYLKDKALIRNNPITHILLKEKKKLILIAGMFCINLVLFYTIFVYLPAYWYSVGKLTLTSSLFINSVNILIMAILIPIIGKMSDKYSYKPIMMISSVGIMVLSYPLFLLFGHAGFLGIMFAQMVFAVLNAAFLAPSPAVYTQLFAANVRYSGVALGMNVSAAIFGGTAPMVMALISKMFVGEIFPSSYIILSSFISFLCVVAIKNTIKENKNKLI